MDVLHNTIPPYFRAKGRTTGTGPRDDADNGGAAAPAVGVVPTLTATRRGAAAGGGGGRVAAGTPPRLPLLLAPLLLVKARLDSPPGESSEMEITGVPLYVAALPPAPAAWVTGGGAAGCSGTAATAAATGGAGGGAHGGGYAYDRAPAGGAHAARTRPGDSGGSVLPLDAMDAAAAHHAMYGLL